MPRRLRRALPAALALAALAAAPAQALDGGTLTGQAGAVTATLSWAGAEVGVADPHLTITRGADPAVVAYDRAITDVCPEGCFLVADAPGYPSILKVADLDADGEPEVLVDTFSGGAHCCTTTRIYDWRGASYGRLSVPWGDASYDLADLGRDGRRELVGADASFGYAFTAYAFSHFPPLVLAYRHVGGRPRTEDVTRRFPAVVRADAAPLLRRIRRGRRSRDDDLRGVVAAYVADQYLLGRGAAGLREADRALRRGLLGSASDPVWAGGRRFRPALLRFLRRAGYR